MTTEEKLIMLKKMVADEMQTDIDDEVLSVYLELAESKILSIAYPYDTDVTEVPAEYESIQLEIAAYLYNKRGAEGETGHSENGINRTYGSADVPSAMLRGIVPKVGVIK